jgi:hypothetical protein
MFLIDAMDDVMTFYECTGILSTGMLRLILHPIR